VAAAALFKDPSMRFFRIVCLITLPLYFISCATTHRLPNYLENVVDTTGHEDVVVPELIIQKNDLLSIQVYSLSIRPDVSDVMFNLPASSAS